MRPDVVVVGGGAIGASTVLELARRGAKVTLLERGPALAAGCSAGNAGLISPSHSVPIANPAALRDGVRWMLKADSPFYLRPRPSVLPWLARFVVASTAARSQAGARVVRRLASASLDLHAELAEGVDTGFERRGILNVYETEAALSAAIHEAAGAAGSAQVLDGDGARGLEPALARDVLGGVYHPGEAQADPLRFVQAVGRAATEAGAEIRTGVEVRALRRVDGGRVAVVTSEVELHPERVVLAAGVWTARLAGSLGVFVPLEGGKGYHVDLEPTGGDPQVPVFMHETRVIATPLPGRLRLSGTLELAGLDLSVSPRRVEAIRRAARRLLRGQDDRTVLEVWSGLRPCAPDGLPVIGCPAGLEGLVLATGHAMKGLALAPVTGLLVAELVAGQPPSHDLAPFNPDRFRPLFGRL